jgi:protein-tyrosine-phosphatase
MIHTGAGSGVFRPRILVVCQANHCRSPLAEFMLREAALRQGVECEVSSAGTEAPAGVEMHPQARATLLRRGIVATNWVSRRLTPELLAEADLILAVDGHQLHSVGETLPECATRSFTLLQFARLATVMRPLSASSPEEFAVELHDATAAARSRVEPPDSVDIPVPTGRGRRAFERCASTIEAAVADVLRAWQAPAGRSRARRGAH